jgi:hypothetical protein
VRLPAVAGFLAVAALVASPAAPTAASRTIKLNWVEQRSKAYYADTPMTFKVKDVTLTARAWSVHASFTNRSELTLRIVRPRGRAANYYAPYGFGLGWGHGLASGASTTTLETLQDNYAKPAFPRELRPGQTWIGVFGGLGLPPKGLVIYVSFGLFYPPGAPANGVKEFDWITMHAFKR